jgi:two-component system cell cycle response regulator DivK
MKTRTVLIIEDNEQNLYLMRFLLEKNGFSVLEARSGRHGLEVAAEAAPDLILLDIQLPEMDGYSVARELRKQEGQRQTPIIVVTSYAMVGDREKALAAGATGYIEKPIDPDNFVGQLHRHMPGSGEGSV